MKRLHIIVVVAAVALILVLSLIFSAKNTSDEEKVSAASYLKEAESAYNEGKLSEAKVLYETAKEIVEDATKLKKIQSRIEDINIKILFSPIIDECSIKYVVKPKDALVKIAKKFGTTVNLIKSANGLKSNIIRPGQELKINTCKFSIAVDKSQNLLFLKSDGKIIKTYVVSTGKDNSTPVGSFKIINKLANPTWFKTGAVIPPDSPENILGSRWMGFDRQGYGIHGTTDPDNLGKQITLGCVRMANKDVEELFDIVAVGTEVEIVD